MKEGSYIAGDRKHNFNEAVRVFRKLYWNNDISPESAKEFIEAEQIILSAIAFSQGEVIIDEEVKG